VSLEHATGPDVTFGPVRRRRRPRPAQCLRWYCIGPGTRSA